MLKDRREAAGLTQRGLADRAGLSFRTIQVWESAGTANAKAGKLKRAASALGCTVDELLDDCPPTH